MHLYADKLLDYRTHDLQTARRSLAISTTTSNGKKERAHLSLWLYRPRLRLSWYLPTTEKLLITTGINSTCGGRPSHYSSSVDGK